MYVVGTIAFIVATSDELRIVNNRNMGTEEITYLCAGCSNVAHGRIVAKAEYRDEVGSVSGIIYWCICPCGSPAVIKMQNMPQPQMFQSPRPSEFAAGESWPQDLGKLFMEGSAALSANAFTACAMVCRKLLMVVACKQGDSDGKTFKEYVTYILDNVVPIPAAKNSIDAIRQIGNEANHDVAFVTEGGCATSHEDRAICVERRLLSTDGLTTAGPSTLLRAHEKAASRAAAVC